MQTQYWKFAVLGQGAFPLDMLRYDRACFDQPDDVSRATEKGNRVIHLVCFFSPPTEARWNSFGWHFHGAVSKGKA